MFNYEIILNFNPGKANKFEIDAFCEFADKYDALVLRKEEEEISRMYISTEDCINLAELSKNLNKKILKIYIY